MATVKKVRKSVAPYYGVAVTWVIYALLFDLYKVSNFVFAGLLSAGMFLLLRAVCKDETYEVEVPDPKPEPVSTGSAELDKMLQDGARAISEMKRLDDNIADEKISADIRRLETVSQSIFDQVKAQPAKLPQIRKFMDYYLPHHPEAAERLRPHERRRSQRGEHRYHQDQGGGDDGHHRLRL